MKKTAIPPTIEFTKNNSIAHLGEL
jgi:hypothetical protein